MIYFDKMINIREKKPAFVSKTIKDNVFYEYSDFCFVKTQEGFGILRYMECKEHGKKYWFDNTYVYQVSDEDVWHLLSSPQTLTLSKVYIEDFFSDMEKRKNVDNEAAKNILTDLIAGYSGMDFIIDNYLEKNKTKITMGMLSDAIQLAELALDKQIEQEKKKS